MVSSNLTCSKPLFYFLKKYLPHLKQALSVKNALTDMWKANGDLRTIVYVEFKYLQKFEQKDDLAAVNAYLANLFKTKLSDTYFYKQQFDKYAIVKPKEAEIKVKVNEFRERAYQLAQPKAHNYVLVYQK